MVLRGEYVNKTASDKVILQHCQVSVSLSWQILPTDIIVLYIESSAQLSVTKEGRRMRRVRRAKASTEIEGCGGRKGERNLYCYMYHTSKENQMNVCLYAMLPREGLSKREILKFL